MPPPAQNREQWRVSVLASILWSRGHALRAVALPLYNRYVEAQSATERLLLSQWLTAREKPIDPRQDGWLKLAHDALRTRQLVTLSLPANEASAWMRDRIEWTYSIPEPL